MPPRARLHTGLALAALALLSACGWTPPPPGYSPASLSCKPPQGTFAVDANDLRWLDPGGRLPRGARFQFLAIEPYDNYQFSLVFSRRPEDVLAEANTLRLTDPDTYRAWRARHLGEPLDGSMLQALGRNSGPVVDYRLAFPNRDCRGGWYLSAEGARTEPAPGGADRLVYVSLAQADDGMLLVRHEVRESRGDIGSFFGQPLRWYVHAEYRWHRLAAVPEALRPGPLDPAALPPAHSMIDRMAIEREADRNWGQFGLAFRNSLPADVVVTVFRRRQFDPSLLDLPPGAQRIEIAGHWPEGQPDPFLERLQAEPRVTGIEVKQSRYGPRNRPYRLIEFTLQPAPRAD